MTGLDIGEHIKWLLLDRVHQGRITKSYPNYLDDGRRIWYTAEQAFATLVEVGLLQLGEPGPDGMRPVSLTEKGLVKFKALCERQQDGG